jgi:hypothetical protein
MNIDFDIIRKRKDVNDRIDTPYEENLFEGSELSFSVRKFDPQYKKRAQRPLRPKEVDLLMNRLY